MTNMSETTLMLKDAGGRWTFSTTLKNLSALTIHHGVKSCKIKTKTIEQTPQTFIIEPIIFEELSLPSTLKKYRIQPINPGEWILGPFVGILTSESMLKKLLSQEDAALYDRYAEVLERNQGLAVFFSLERILWDQGKVIGVIRDPSKSEGSWREQVLPIPKVIYDRSYGIESKVEGMSLRSKCASLNQNIKIINALPRLGKMEIYQLCSQDNTLRRHLPQWDILRRETAESLLAKFPVAYIKPNDFCKGAGVTKVTQTSYGFLVEQQCGRENYQHQCKNVEEVLQVLGDCLDTPMVVQEAIPLRTYEGGPFDFRLLLQKNDNGQWQQTGLVARVFGKESVISSPRSGGKVTTYDEAMKDLPDPERERIASSLLNLALDIAHRIEEQFGLYAELGFDLGVDSNGNIWLIEVNGKPLKISIERLNNKAMTAAAYEHPLEYAIYLAGFDCIVPSDETSKISIENNGSPEIIRSVEIRKTASNIKITKKATYEHLIKYASLKNHIPLFLPYTPKNLAKMIHQRDLVYIKPVCLYKGKEIIKVSKNSQKYFIEFRSKDSNKKIICQSLENLFEKLNKILLPNLEYVLQEGIQLATFLGNPFDVRVILQKKGLQWTVSTLHARIAPMKSVITGPRGGGKVFRLREVLALAFPFKENQILQTIQFLSEDIGCRMEEKHGCLGQLRIDLGIDVNGKVWLLEVNRPIKGSFKITGGKTIAKVIHKNPILPGFLPSQLLGSLYSFKSAPQHWPSLTQDQSPKILFLNSQQMHSFKLKSKQKILLQIGFTSVEVEIRIQRMNAERNTMFLSHEALAAFPYYHGEKVSLISVSDSRFVLQPIVGMTLSHAPHPFCKEGYEIQKSALLALEKGIFFYYFCLDKIDWNKKKVLAYYLDPLKKDWNQKYLPFPQVLYDKATFPFDPEKRLKTKQNIRRLSRNHDLQVINSARYFDKWHTYKALDFFKETKKFVPETTLLSLKDLEYYLDNFEFSFVKSNCESFGSEVLRVERREKCYLCRTGGSKVKEWKFNCIKDLYRFLEDRIGSCAILQKGIHLAKINQKIFDMRVLCQKNNEGQWIITAVNYRIAPLGGIGTNYSAGAEEILAVPAGVMHYPCLSWEKLTQFSKKVLFALESSFGLMGEIGLDVGLDTQGNLWLIEANSKPDTHGYRELTTEKICSQIYGLPLDYAQFLVRRIFQT